MKIYFIFSATPGSEGKGNSAGSEGDCPMGFVCLKRGNCGGMQIISK